MIIITWLDKEDIPSVQFSRSVVSDSATPWTAAHQASLSITNSQSLLKLMSIESVMSSNHLILCRLQEPTLEIPPMTRSWGRAWQARQDQDLRDSLIPPMTRSCGRTWWARQIRTQRDPLDLLEHLPQNQNLSLYCLLYYTLLTLTGAVPDHLSLEKVNLELQLVSCI